MRFRVTAGVLVALVVAACGSGAASPGTSSAPSTAPSVAPTGPDTTISGELNVWHYLTTDAHLRLLEDITKPFNAKYPNVTVKYDFVPVADMTSKLLATAAASQGPDVAVFNWGDVQALAEAGVVQDMDRYWAAFPDAGAFSPSTVHKVNDKVYVSQAYANLIAVWYNKDILDKYSITPPKTMDEFEVALATITAGGDGGLAIDGKPAIDGWWTGMPFFRGQGIDITMSGPQVAPTFARLRSWVEKGFMPQEVVSWDQDTVFNQFLTGKFAFAVGGNWYAETAKAATFNYGVIPIPAGSQPSSVYLGGEGEAIGAFAANPDLAWAYLEATWFSKEGQLLALKAVGNLPTRSDAAQDPYIASSPILPAFSEAVQSGVPLPITPAENEAQTLMGDLWSAVLSGQKTPDEAAAELAAKIPGILK
jgi:multiple sugar transport system substrate-binding protein